MNTQTKELVVDTEGIEYYLVKMNRVNWIVERISDGARLQGPAQMFTLKGIAQVEAPVIDPLIRIGALVRVKPDANIWSYKKFTNEYEYEQQFVIMDFGKIHGEFRIIEVGGNARNTYYQLPAKDLVRA